MTFLRRVLPTVLLGVLLWALAPAVPLRADGEEPPTARNAPDFVAQLTPEELAFLRARIKDWDTLDPHKRQMMARNVLRIRSMSPEQRKAFEERLHRMRGHGKDFAEGPHAVLLVNRALAQAAMQRLGPEFEARLQRADVSAYVFEMSFARAFWSRVSETAFADAQPPAPESLSGDLPRRHVERYAKAYAAWQGEQDPARKAQQRKRLGFAYHALRAEQLRQEVGRSGAKGGPEAYVTAVAKRVLETWPRAFAAVLEDPDALLKSAENEEVRRSLRRLLRRDGRLQRDESTLLARLLERWGASAREGAAGEESDAVLRRVLREDLGVAPDVLETLPPRDQAAARVAWLRALWGRVLGLRVRGGAPGPGPAGEHRKGAGPRRPGGWARPEGLTDAQWEQIRDALQRAVITRSKPVRPAGVDEQIWESILQAFRQGRANAGAPPVAPPRDDKPGGDDEPGSADKPEGDGK